jgi:hypothetical protein
VSFPIYIVITVTAALRKHRKAKKASAIFESCLKAQDWIRTDDFSLLNQAITAKLLRPS